MRREKSGPREIREQLVSSLCRKEGYLLKNLRGGQCGKSGVARKR